MLRRLGLGVALACLGLSVVAQEQEEKKLTLNFRDASLDAVLQYVSSVTGWIFVQEKKVSGTITAVSDTQVPPSRCLELLNAALRPHGAVIPNPYSPALPKPGQILKVQDVDEAKRRNIEIYTGSNPDDIPVTDQVRTQIMPLKAVNVVEVNKELGDLLKNAVGSDGQVAISTYSNSVVLTGRSDGINRVARILRVIDVSASAELKIRVFPLRNADAVETAKTLNEVFRREAMRAETGRQDGGLGNIMRMFGGGGDRGGDRGGSGASPQPRALAHEMVRITAEPRTNSVIVSATDDNIKLIEDLIRKLDDKTAAAIRLKLYPLRYADATAAAKLLNDLFQTPGGQQGGNRQGGFVPFWMGGGGSQGGRGGSQPQAQDGGMSAKEVRAVADLRTNSILVAASEVNLVLIDGIVMELDRQVNDLLEVKIYKLKNADAVEMATILQSLFRPQVQATQSAGRPAQQGQGGGSMRFSGQGQTPAGGTLAPSQEVEITSDKRTRSVVVKASREYIAVMDDVVKQLDADPTESVQTFVVPLKNADALTTATMFQNLLKGTAGGSNLTNPMSNQQQRGPFSGMNLNPQGMNPQGSGQGGGFGGSTRGAGSGFSGSRTRGQNLGPLGQEAPGPPPQEEEPRRAIEGQADVQADPSTNALVIRTSPRNFEAMRAVLGDLDRMRPQVLIKCLIADVTLDDNTQFGLEGFWENKMHVRGGDLATNRLATDFAMATTGFTYLLTGDEFQANLNLFAREGKLKILATPRILALDNQPANILVGKQVPRITSSQINQLGNTINSVQYERVGIFLEVIPHINPDGLVTMVVTPEVSDVASAAESIQIAPGANNPTFTVNMATTTVAVRTGTTIVIGGLIRETSDESVEKIPILGDIPLLGYLFSNTTKKKVKRELMIFLTPYVAYTAAELEEITQLEKSRLRLLDPRDIEAESDRWLERVRR